MRLRSGDFLPDDVFVDAAVVEGVDFAGGVAMKENAAFDAGAEEEIS